MLPQGIQQKIGQDLRVLRTEVNTGVDIFLLTKLKQELERVMSDLEKVRITSLVLAGFNCRPNVRAIAAHDFPPCAGADHDFRNLPRGTVNFAGLPARAFDYREPREIEKIYTKRFEAAARTLGRAGCPVEAAGLREGR